MEDTPRGDPRLERFERATHAPMVGVSLVVVPLYIAQVLTEDSSSWVPTSLRIARQVIQLVMAADIGTRTILAPRRLSYLASHKLDVLAVLVPPVRALRDMVALRAILVRPGLARFATFALVTTTAGALLVYGSEQGHDDSTIDSLGEALWWSIVTATTVGYGDNVPVTTQGRIAAVLLMLLGITIFSVLTAHVAAQIGGRDGPRPTTVELTDRLAGIETAIVALERNVARLLEADEADLP